MFYKMSGLVLSTINFWRKFHKQKIPCSDVGNLCINFTCSKNSEWGKWVSGKMTPPFWLLQLDSHILTPYKMTPMQDDSLDNLTPNNMAPYKMTPIQDDSHDNLTPITRWLPLQDDSQYKLTPMTSWLPVQDDSQHKLTPVTSWLPVQVDSQYKMTPSTRWLPVQDDSCSGSFIHFKWSELCRFLSHPSRFKA